MQIYLVGGAVRDTLLGLEPAERDWVVVGATHKEMLDCGFRPVGRDFPVYLHPETHEEYALARRERKSGHGYTGFVVETAGSISLEDDLLRRDLTINAMAMDAAGTLIDPHGGKKDLERGLLRHVSSAFIEDPLRVLRVARFAARFARRGFVIVPETMDLLRLITKSGELEHLVAERVWSETRRALEQENPDQFFRVLRDCGALTVIFPEIARLFGVPQPPQHHPEVDTGEHLLLCLAQAARLGLSGQARFAVLMHDLGKGLTPPELWPKHIGHEKAGAVAVRATCKRLRVPAKWRELAVLVCLHHTRCHRALEMKATALVALLEDLDAFRNRARFEEFLAACEADARGRQGLEERSYTQAQRLRDALERAGQVNPASVVSKGFSGARIGVEIRRLRRAAVKQLLADEAPSPASGRAVGGEGIA